MKRSAVRKRLGIPVGAAIAAVATAAVLLAGPPAASAQTGPVFGRAVDRAIDRVIAPGYADLAAAAGGLAVA